MEIGKLKKAGQDTASLQLEMRAAADRVTLLDEKVKELDDEFRGILTGIPNLPQAAVPVGKSEHDNVEIRRWGKPPGFPVRTQSPLGSRPRFGHP